MSNATQKIYRCACFLTIITLPKKISLFHTALAMTNKKFKIEIIFSSYQWAVDQNRDMAQRS